MGKNKKNIQLTLGSKIWKVLITYFKTQFILMLIVGLLTWGILFLLKVKFAIPLAILTGVLSGVPNFGIIIATIVATLVAIFDKVVFLPNATPLVEGLAVMVIFIILNKFVDLILAPIFLGKTNKVSPFVIFMITLLGTVLFGVAGAILAVPLYLVIKTVIEHQSGRE